jgi:hypothetical protein
MQGDALKRISRAVNDRRLRICEARMGFSRAMSGKRTPGTLPSL